MAKFRDPEDRDDWEEPEDIDALDNEELEDDTDFDDEDNDEELDNDADLDDELYTEENPEGIVAYGVWHRIERIDGRLVLVEVPMAQYRGQGVEEDEDDLQILELDELSDAWMQAATEQGADLPEGEWIYFRYPEEDDEDPFEGLA